VVAAGFPGAEDRQPRGALDRDGSPGFAL